MEFLLTKRYSWLCLCLLFCCSWFSCAVHTGARQTIVPVKNQESFERWILKISLLAGSEGFVFPVSGLQGIKVASSLTVISFRGNYREPIILEYHFNSEAQCCLIRDELLSTGMVNVISMVKLSN